MFFSIGQRGTCGEHTDVEIRKKSQYHTAAFLQQDTYTQLSSLCIHMLIFKRARSVIQLEMDT